MAKSVCDYIFRWLGLKFLPVEERPFDPRAAQPELFVPNADSAGPKAIEPKALAAAVTIRAASSASSLMTTFVKEERRIFMSQADAPSCPSCGSITVRCGACYKCENCGSTTGCG